MPLEVLMPRPMPTGGAWYAQFLTISSASLDGSHTCLGFLFSIT